MACAVPDDLRRVIERCLAGEQAAMAEMVDRYRERVLSLCLRMLGHRQDAEDAAQESFVRALRSLKNWDASRGFEPWLLSIAGNRCRTSLARRLHRPLTNLAGERVVDHRHSERAADHLAEEVKLALRALRDEYRRAFELFHGEQLSYLEIGAVLAVPVGTVKTWVHRARRELIERLQRRGVVEETSTCTAAISKAG